MFWHILSHTHIIPFGLFRVVLLYTILLTWFRIRNKISLIYDQHHIFYHNCVEISYLLTQGNIHVATEAGTAQCYFKSYHFSLDVAYERNKYKPPQTNF